MSQDALDLDTARALVERLRAMEDEVRAEFVASLGPEDLDLLEQAVAIIERDAPSQRFASPDALGRHVDPRHFVGGVGTVISRAIVEAVEAVERGENRRIIVACPPRAGKSQMTSVYGPAWMLHRHPDWNVVLASAEASLATGWSRKVRRLVDATPELGVALQGDSQAASEWETTAGGGLLARGVRGSLTGHGARALIVDDPLRSLADAMSPAVIQALTEWWTAVAVPRLEAPSLVLVTATRWTVNDLSGQLLDGRLGDPSIWTVIDAPAVAQAQSKAFPYADALGREPGEYLPSPLRPDDLEEYWRSLEQAVGRTAWNALYLGRPVPEEGDVFTVSDFRLYENGAFGTADRLLTSWDLSFGADGDWTVGQVWGVHGSDLVLHDQVRGKWTFTEQLAQINDLLARWPGATQHLVEKAANGAAMLDVLKRDVRGLKAIKPTKAKEVRAMAVAPLVEAGNVWLPRNQPWTDDLLGEVRDFPKGSHDDQVDAMTQALAEITARGPATITSVAGRTLGGSTARGGLAARAL